MSFLGKFFLKSSARIGEMLEHSREGSAVRVRGQMGSLQITSPAEGVMRIMSDLEGEFNDDRTVAVAPGTRSGKTDPDVSENAEALDVRVAGLRLVVSKKSILLSCYDDEGTLLFRDYPAAGLTWTGRGVKVTHLLERGSRFYGFGEKTGPLDKTGRSMTMWNTDMPYTTNYEPIYLNIPFMLVLREGRAHGLFFDNPCRSSFKVGSQAPWLYTYQAEAGELDLYVIGGPRVADVVERFTALTGRMPMPPRWSLGHHQCRYSYMNESEVRRIADNFRKRDIPTDAIWFDIHYMDRYRVFTLNEKRFPDMKKLTSDLNRDGFKAVTAMDPGVAAKDDFHIYREGREKGYFCRHEKGGEFNARVWPGKSAFPDFSRPEVQKWWGDNHKILLDAGVEGIWNDMNEPSSWTVDIRAFNAMLPLHPIRKPKMVHGEPGRDIPHISFRNMYGLKECQGTYEGLLRHRPEKRPFILTRSGYAGIQKYAAVWTGDNSSTFSHLALSVPMLLNLGLSGVPFAGPDIGGFMWNCSPELYARWIQLGAFYPFCRTHCAIKMRRQEPWTFGDRITRIARDYLKLRYRLFPTLYSLFRESHESGAPVLRPLFYEFQEERPAAQIEDQLMFGPWLMLAPVLKKRQTRREVYLPAATWTDYWTGERIKGPKVVTRDAPLELLPLYVRDGAILFMWPPLRWLDEKPADRLFIELYPPVKGSSAVLYEDDGQSLDYEQGGFCKRRVFQEKDSNGVFVRIAAREGRFEPPARRLVLKIYTDARPESVVLDGKDLRIGGGVADCEYIISDRALRASLPDDGGAHELVIKY